MHQDDIDWYAKGLWVQIFVTTYGVNKAIDKKKQDIKNLTPNKNIRDQVLPEEAERLQRVRELDKDIEQLEEVLLKLSRVERILREFSMPSGFRKIFT